MRRDFVRRGGCLLVTLAVIVSGRFLGDANGQIRAYEVVHSGMPIPGVNDTYEGRIFDSFATCVVNGHDEVLFFGRPHFPLLSKWTPGLLEVVVMSGSTPPVLPPPPASFLNAREEPFEMPRAANALNNLSAGLDGTFYIQTRYADLNVLGTNPWAWLNGSKSGLGFYSGVRVGTIGVAPSAGATMMRGFIGSGAEAMTVIGRYDINEDFKAVIVEGEQAPLQEIGVTHSLGGGTRSSGTARGELRRWARLRGQASLLQTEAFSTPRPISNVCFQSLSPVSRTQS